MASEYPERAHCIWLGEASSAVLMDGRATLMMLTVMSERNNPLMRTKRRRARARPCKTGGSEGMMYKHMPVRRWCMPVCGGNLVTGACTGHCRVR